MVSAFTQFKGRTKWRPFHLFSNVPDWCFQDGARNNLITNQKNNLFMTFWAKNQVNIMMTMTIKITITSHLGGPLLSRIVVKIPGLCQQDIWVQVPAPPLLAVRPWPSYMPSLSFLIYKIGMKPSSTISCDDYTKSIYNSEGIMESPQWRVPVTIIRVEFKIFNS